MFVPSLRTLFYKIIYFFSLALAVLQSIFVLFSKYYVLFYYYNRFCYRRCTFCFPIKKCIFCTIKIGLGCWTSFRAYWPLYWLWLSLSEKKKKTEDSQIWCTLEIFYVSLSRDHKTTKLWEFKGLLLERHWITVKFNESFINTKLTIPPRYYARFLKIPFH